MEPPYVGCYENNLERRLYFWFPAMSVAATPECRGALITNNSVLFAVEVDSMTCAPCDISEMTEQRAFLPILNFGFQFLSRTYRFDKIAKVKNIVVLAFDLADNFVVQIVDGAVVSRDSHRAFFAVEVDPDRCALESSRIAALSFPGDRFVAVIKMNS